VQQLGLGPLMAAWADSQLSQPSAMEEVGPQCARLLAALVTGALLCWAAALSLQLQVVLW